MFGSDHVRSSDQQKGGCHKKKEKGEAGQANRSLSDNGSTGKGGEWTPIESLRLHGGIGIPQMGVWTQTDWWRRVIRVGGLAEARE